MTIMNCILKIFIKTLACRVSLAVFLLSPFIIISSAQADTGNIPAETVTGRMTAMNGFVWNYGYDIEQKDHRVLIHVAINLVPASGVTRPELDRVKNSWEKGIERIWSEKFSIKTPSGRHCPVIIDVTFTGTRFHHYVIVRRAGGNDDELNWNLLSTPEVAAHEFGHMIGVFDEYRGGAISTDIGITDRMSIMTGNPDKSGVTFARHYEGIRKWFTEKTGLSGVSLISGEEYR